VPIWTRSPRHLSELRLIAVGRIGQGPEAELFARYASRLRPRLTVSELADGRGSAAEIKRREADAILAGLHPNALAVALDPGGVALRSEALATQLAGWIDSGRPVCFIIGGAEGLDARLIARADAVLSLGPLTWPHLLARVMLAEQLFRARAIAAGHPYHRPGRP
jgi:23S rRNA (pseudouridine1915-N3)-methyltransferase